MSMSKNFIKNSYFYKPNGDFRGGVFVNLAHGGIKPNDPDHTKTDRENRDFVVNSIIELINNGKSLEQACEILAGDKNTTDNFKYLLPGKIKENPDDFKKKIAEIFANWYNGRVREKRQIEKGERC